MSEFSVPVVVVGPVAKHPNADTLSCTSVFGENCIVRTGTLREGDLAVYVPIEAVVPLSLEPFAFLKRHDETTARIRAVRLRGTYSEGLLLPLKDFSLGTVTVGADVAEALGIKKYEEPVRTSTGPGGIKNGMAARGPSNVPVYNVEQLLRNLDQLPEGVEVQVTEKIHGCNARAVYLSKEAAQKAGVAPGLHVGSHNVWRKSKEPLALPMAIWVVLKSIRRALPGLVAGGLAGLKERLVEAREGILATWRRNRSFTEDTWIAAVRQAGLPDVLKDNPNLAVYGEIFGNVQDLKYGIEGVDFRAFAVYDVLNRFWWSPEDVHEFCAYNGLKHVPILYEGPFDLEGIKHLAFAKESTLHNGTIREGVVVRAKFSQKLSVMMKMKDLERHPLKLVSPHYKLRKEGTEFH